MKWRLDMKPIKVILIAGLLTLGGFLIWQALRQDDIGKINFPQRTSDGLALPAKKTGDDRRDIEYHDDKRTPAKITVEHANGNVGYSHHRKDGTIFRLEEFYPSDPQGHRQLKSEANLAADGKTYISDKAYRSNGTLERIGSRIDNGAYDIVLYHDDGKSVSKHQVVSADKKPLLEETFGADGVMTKKAVLNPDNSFEVTTYLNGKRAFVSLKSQYGREEQTYYRGDGETIEMKVLLETYQTAATYFLPDGKVEQVRTFSNEVMEVVVFNNGVPHHRQKWQLVNTSATGPNDKREYKLIEVALLRPDGKPTQVIELAADGKTPKRIITPHNPDQFYGQRTIKEFRPDGTVEKEVVRTGDFGKVESTKTYPAGVKETVDPALTVHIPYREPPRPVPPPVPDHPF